MIRGTERPTVKGRVVDEYGSPIKNSSVQVDVLYSYMYDWSPDLPVNAVDVDDLDPGVSGDHQSSWIAVSEDGSFTVQGLGRWGIYFPPMHLLPYRGKARVAITASGYQSQEIRFDYDGDHNPWGIGWLVTQQLGDVVLSPVSH